MAPSKEGQAGTPRLQPSGVVSFAQTLGLASGVFALIIIVGIGIGALLAASPLLFSIFRFGGCA